MKMSMIGFSTVVLLMCANTNLSMPMVDNPYLSMTINREDLGSGFNMAVNRQNMNLAVSGNLSKLFIATVLKKSPSLAGPPAPYVGFPGSRTYYQPAFRHIAPFLAFNTKYP